MSLYTQHFRGKIKAELEKETLKETQGIGELASTWCCAIVHVKTGEVLPVVGDWESFYLMQPRIMLLRRFVPVYILKVNNFV